LPLTPGNRRKQPLQFVKASIEIAPPSLLCAEGLEAFAPYLSWMAAEGQV